MTIEVITGDAATEIAKLTTTIQTCITSPPYFNLRDYGSVGQIGIETSVQEYIDNLVAVFRAVRNILADSGTIWVNLGDTYSNKTIKGSTIKAKDLIGIPWMFAFAMRADGWYLRQDIIWAKPNPFPESITDRCTKAHEYIFLFSKQPDYFYDRMAIAEPAIYAEEHARKATSWGKKKHNVSKNNIEKYQLTGIDNNRTCLSGGKRNKRSVWNVKVQPFKGAHFATYPEALIEPCILATSQEGDTVLDPFNGAGTTGVVAKRHGRNYIGIELNSEYAELSRERIAQTPGPIGESPFRLTGYPPDLEQQYNRWLAVFSLLDEVPSFTGFQEQYNYWQKVFIAEGLTDADETTTD